MSWQGPEACYSKITRHYAWSQWWEELLGSPLSQEQGREVNLWLGPLGFPQKSSKEHIILGLSFSLCTAIAHAINGTNKNTEGIIQILIRICPSSVNLHALEVKKHTCPSPFPLLHEALENTQSFLMECHNNQKLIEETDFYLSRCCHPIFKMNLSNIYRNSEYIPSVYELCQGSLVAGNRNWPWLTSAKKEFVGLYLSSLEKQTNKQKT